jgi:hypothetical protein
MQEAAILASLNVLGECDIPYPCVFTQLIESKWNVFCESNLSKKVICGEGNKTMQNKLM